MDDAATTAEMIARIIMQSSRESISQLCEELEKLTIGADLDKISSTARHIQQAETRASFVKLITTVRSQRLSISAHSLSLALRSASATSVSKDGGNNLELVWSGPSRSLSTLRRTDQALADVITEAKTTLLVVSFAVHKVPNVMSALGKAIERGVSVGIIIETAKESGGKLRFDGLKELKNSNIGAAQVFVWPESARPKTESGLTGVLHAKCAVADSKVALISSANLTEAALHLNMELGIIVNGSTVPSEIEDHFNALISEGIIRQVNL